MCPHFLRRLFLHEKRGMRSEISLLEKFVFTVFLGDLEGVCTLCPPPYSSYIQNPCTIRVKLRIKESLYDESSREDTNPLKIVSFL